MWFEFATATRIIFGPGALEEVASLAEGMGRRAFVVTGHNPERAGRLVRKLKKCRLFGASFPVPGEPTVELVRDGVKTARQADCDLVIALGGGSVLDTGKAVAAMLTNCGELEDYLEVVGLGKPLEWLSAPNIAIPTTAGTGAEVTSNAVLGVPELGLKVSLRSRLMLPRLAVIDPLLTFSLPPEETAATGLDALTQLIEAYVSIKANPLTGGLCREGITLAGRALRRAYENGADGLARQDMALAALFSGLALANSGLGAVHGIAGPLGGMFPAPHGVICARLLPFVMEQNVKALRERGDSSAVLERYAEIACLLTGKPGTRESEGVKWIKNLCRALEVPRLAVFGLTERSFPVLVEKSLKASSMKGNPVALTEAELLEILKKEGSG